QNYPNPFNPTTIISYRIADAGEINLKVFDLLGNEIEVLVNEFKSPGDYSVSFDASLLSSGIYIYRLISGDKTDSRKMLLIR
ncbi:MAG: T9SS type A sorting domain-containing protein, partial [Ignavibacteriaceae bacterium]|nr:T9SS type A sorting domain-containing protein [Ignavibacteriaceae bacterium]